MKTYIGILKKTREFLFTTASDLTIEQLNIIPSNFNNNIAWNLGHIIAAQQSLCYVRSGIPKVVDDAYFERYKSGSKPEQKISAVEMEKIKVLAFSTLDTLGEDYDKDIFKHFDPVTLRYGITINSIEDAIRFLLYHEGIHLGYIWALKRAIQM